MKPGCSTADLHIHTTASDGTATPAEVLEFASEATGLSVVAICDHNTTEGAHEAAAIAARYRVEVVIGQEVESADGHILGLWAPVDIEPGLSAEETVARVHAQGGVAIAAHPFAPRWWHRHGLCRGDREIYDHVPFDGIEVANSTPLLFLANYRARGYQRAHAARLASTGGSDAHMLSVIGTSRTLFAGSTAQDLRRAISARTTRGLGPSFQPLRAYRYARKVPEIRERDALRRQREAVGGEGCVACSARCAGSIDVPESQRLA